MNKKKQRNIRPRRRISYIPLFVILTGVLILLYPLLGNYLASFERSEATRNYDQTINQMSVHERKEQWNSFKKYNDFLARRSQRKQINESFDQTLDKPGEMLGMIDIPAINIKRLPIYSGTSYKTLKKGLGHLEGSSIPIGGNHTRSVVTGHSGLSNQVLFSDIIHLKKGDIFFIRILGKNLAYEVRSTEEILPKDVEKVKIRSNEDMVTLLTCTPPGINTYRLLVNGYRIPYQQAVERKITKRNWLSYQNIVITSLLLCSVFWIVFRLKQKER